MNLEDGRFVVRCRDRVSLDRAKSLVNLESCWFCSGMMDFSIIVFWVVSGVYEKHDQYVALEKVDVGDLEAEKSLGV